MSDHPTPGATQLSGQESPAAALEYLRQLSWGNQMLWIISALFQMQGQIDAMAKVVNSRENSNNQSQQYDKRNR